MTKANHESEIKIQICLAEKIYSVKLREIVETLGLHGDWGETHEKTSPLYTFKCLLL